MKVKPFQKQNSTLHQKGNLVMKEMVSTKTASFRPVEILIN